MVMKKELVIKYDYHTYKETWEKSEYYCPKCGKQAVWEERSEGDYYLGAGLLCTECGLSFHMPSIREEPDKYDIQRLKQLKSKGNHLTP